MNKVVIEAENLSKIYRLGTLGAGSLRQDIKNWWTKSIQKKEDPFFNVVDARFANDEQKNNQYIWALRDVSFQINQGEVWGIVGKNGAGKSTLLKIISRIITPSQGVLRGRGKVSSLLELGAGFHRELSGRENIFLSGYTLGMSKQEVKQKFDEIVAFSGIYSFIDTPVKRYSSGMYVRLAFSVAAHLEPDILIVDEVLAVGDAEFHAKSLQKMKEFAGDRERTILFVSHNLHAVNTLCSHAMWLQQGKFIEAGETKNITHKYLHGIHQNHLRQSWDDLTKAPGTDLIKLTSVELIPQNKTEGLIDTTTPLDIEIKWINKEESKQNLRLSIQLFTPDGVCLIDIPSSSSSCTKGAYKASCTIPARFLNSGAYYISITYSDDSGSLFTLSRCIEFDIADNPQSIIEYGKGKGYIRPHFPVTIHSISEHQY
jgi:lipopolysaccharide transport system ATP-binding protein